MWARYLRTLIAAVLVSLFLTTVAYGEEASGDWKVITRFDFTANSPKIDLLEGEVVEHEGDPQVARRLGTGVHMRVLFLPKEVIPVTEDLVMRVRYKNVGTATSTMVNQFFVDTKLPNGEKKIVQATPKPLEMGQWQVREFVITELKPAQHSAIQRNAEPGEVIWRLILNSRGNDTGEEHGIYVDYVEFLVPAN